MKTYRECFFIVVFLGSYFIIYETHGFKGCLLSLALSTLISAIIIAIGEINTKQKPKTFIYTNKGNYEIYP